MKTAFYILLIALIPQLSWAQGGKVGEVKNRAERKAENRLDRKIDQGIDKGLNKIENLFKKKNKNNNSNSKNKSNNTSNNNSNSNSNNNSNSSANKGNTTGGGIGLFGKQKEVDLPAQYQFTSDITMEMKNYKNDPDKADVQEVTYLFPKPGDEYVGCAITPEGEEDMEDIMTVIEPEHMISFITTDGNKFYNVIDLSKIAESVDDEDGESDMELKKTGKTKTILGYKCEEYLAEDDDMKANYWVTADLEEMGKNMYGVFYSMSQQMKKKNRKNNSWMQVMNGMVLEMEVYTKKSKETSHMIAIEVNEEKSSSFSTDGYQALSVGNMMNNSGN